MKCFSLIKISKETLIFNENTKIEYLYNALGEKVQKKVTQMTVPSFNEETGTTIPSTKVETTTLYLNGFQYLNGALDVFPHAQGLVSVSGNNYTYLYQYKDHLGNIRLTYKDVNGVATITDENHYYPLGMKITESNFVTWALSSAQKYRYNGQEWQDELGLNMTAMDFRQYDNAIGRFVARDPLAELDYSVTPYHFANNNPINFSDPSGLCPECNTYIKNPVEGLKFIDSKGTLFEYENGEWIGRLNEVVKKTKRKSKKVESFNYSFGGGGTTSNNFMSEADSKNTGINPGGFVYIHIGGSGGAGGNGNGLPSLPLDKSTNNNNVAKNTPKPVKVSRFGGGKLVNKNGKVFNVDKAVKYLNSKALPGFGRGSCSPFVPRAINAGFEGKEIVPSSPTTKLAGSAYGPSLLKAGFSVVSVNNLSEYSPIKGDIAVMNGPPGSRNCNTGVGGPCGHIQMYNGRQWVSDFFQTRPFWPGKSYQDSKPDFKIYRW